MALECSLVGCLTCTKYWICSLVVRKPGVVMRTCNLSTWKVDSDGSEIQGPKKKKKKEIQGPLLHNEFKANFGYLKLLSAF